MKSILWTLAAVSSLASLAGCHHQPLISRRAAPGQSYAQHGGGGWQPQSVANPNSDYVAPLPPDQRHAESFLPAGPASPTYAYPYYTTRGPRDFLLDQPPTIGR